MAVAQHLLNTRVVEALSRVRRLAARMDCLDATAALEQSVREEQKRIEDRDAALGVWQATLASGVLPPEQIAAARGWVLDREGMAGLAASGVAASRTRLAGAMADLAAAQAGEEIAQAVHRAARRTMLRHLDERDARDAEDRILRGTRP